MAKRYGVLPSHLLKYGDSLDIVCAEAGQKWENDQHRKANGETVTPELSENEMLAMVERAKKRGLN